MTPQQIAEHHAQVREIVHPAVYASNAERKRIQAARYDKGKSRTKFRVGSAVMLRDPVRKSKLDPRWLGPYTVVQAHRSGTFSLLDQQKILLDRRVPPDQLKLIAEPFSSFQPTSVQK